MEGEGGDWRGAGWISGDVHNPIRFSDCAQYLGHFVSGVPFDGQKQLWKRLWHVNAVMPAEKQVNRQRDSL